MVAPGGQAGASSRIENYLGFPTGISGSDLTQRALVQAEKFGAESHRPVRGHRHCAKQADTSSSASPMGPRSPAAP